MKRDLAIKKLSGAINEIRRSFGVRQIAVFGSAARGEAGPGSDVDILVEFDGKATFDSFMDLKFYLEELLGNPVDLVTEKAVRPQMRPIINKEKVNVA